MGDRREVCEGREKRGKGKGKGKEMRKKKSDREGRSKYRENCPVEINVINYDSVEQVIYGVQPIGQFHTKPGVKGKKENKH